MPRIAIVKFDNPLGDALSSLASSVSIALLGAACGVCETIAGIVLGVEEGLRGPAQTAALDGVVSTFKNDLADNILYVGIPKSTHVTRVVITTPFNPLTGAGTPIPDGRALSFSVLPERVAVTTDGARLEPWEDRRSPPREAEWELTAQVRRTDAPIAVYPWVAPAGCLTLCMRDRRCTAVTHYFSWFPNMDPAYPPQTCALFGDAVRFDARRSQRCLFHNTPERMTQSVMRGEPPTMTQYWVRREALTAAHRSGRDVAACPS